jgi:hypothetical protein
MHISWPGPNSFWQVCVIFRNIIWKIFFLSKVLCVKQNSSKKEINPKKSPKIVAIAYNMKSYLKIFYFQILKVTNLTKYAYGWSLLEEHHKIDKQINKL